MANKVVENKLLPFLEIFDESLSEDDRDVDADLIRKNIITFK